MKKQGHEEITGGAKITPGFNLPARYILHTVGPVIYGRVTEEDCRLLASCYRSCLELAVENGCKCIAFCCISTGEFRFPNRRAAEIAVGTVKDFLRADKKLGSVIFNVFKEKVSRKFGDFKIHCMMDEIGKLHPNNVKGILDFANCRNILLVNSSPTTYNVEDYRYTYLLSKDGHSNTQVVPLLTYNQK